MYIDKNHPPAELKTTIEAIELFAKNSDASVRKLALIPQINDKYKEFPFSLQFFIQCYVRCLDRDGHITMKNDDPQRLAKLLVIFFQ